MFEQIVLGTIQGIAEWLPVSSTSLLILTMQNLFGHQDGFQAIFAFPYLVLYPGLAIAATMMSFTFLGDGLRDALDPRMRR